MAGLLESTKRLLEEGDPHPVDELADRRSGRAVEQLKRLRPLAAQLRENDPSREIILGRAYGLGNVIVKKPAPVSRSGQAWPGKSSDPKVLGIGRVIVG